MKRFVTISVFGSKTKDFDIPTWNKKTKRIVDDSHFIPMSEAVKQLSKTSPLSQGVIDVIYDFPDGKDTGMKPPVARLRPDLAVLSQEVRAQNEQLSKDVSKAQQKAKDKAIMDSFKSLPKIEAKSSKES